MFTNYPETWAILKAKRARHPREDAIEEFTDWTLLGNPIEQGDGPKPVAAQVLEVPAQEVKETEEQYIKRKTDFLRHKNIACRRGAGGRSSDGGSGSSPRRLGRRTAEAVECQRQQAARRHTRGGSLVARLLWLFAAVHQDKERERRG